MTDQEFETETTRCFELGLCSRLDELAKEFRIKAGQLYGLGRDEQAKLFRTIAEDFEARHHKERAAYEEKYPERMSRPKEKGKVK